MAQEPGSAVTRDSPANVRAREVEERMTDEEQFSLVVNVMGENPVVQLVRDERTPRGNPNELGLQILTLL